MTGHIRRRGERSWELKFDVGRNERTGTRQTRYHNVKGTKREAQAELTRLTAQAVEGNYIHPAKTTVRNFSIAGCVIGLAAMSARKLLSVMRKLFASMSCRTLARCQFRSSGRSN